MRQVKTSSLRGGRWRWDSWRWDMWSKCSWRWDRWRQENWLGQVKTRWLKMRQVKKSSWRWDRWRWRSNRWGRYRDKAVMSPARLWRSFVNPLFSVKLKNHQATLEANFLRQYCLHWNKSSHGMNCFFASVQGYIVPEISLRKHGSCQDCLRVKSAGGRCSA